MTPPSIEQLIQSIFGLMSGAGQTPPTSPVGMQPSTANPASANPGGFDPSEINRQNTELIKQMMNQQLMHGSHGQHTMLDISGHPQDANAPQGIDWLKANGPQGHSWQEPTNRTTTPNQGAETAALQQIQGQTPSGHNMTTDALGRHVIGSGNGAVGYSVPKGAPNFDVSNIFGPGMAPGNPMEAHTGPFLSQEQSQLGANIQNAAGQSAVAQQPPMQQAPDPRFAAFYNYIRPAVPQGATPQR